jgi:hypothetical protein
MQHYTTTSGKSAGLKPASKNLKPGTEELFGADTADPLVGAPEFPLSAIQDEISKVEALIQNVEDMPENLLLGEIKLASKRVGGFAFEAKRSSTQALLYVWTSGMLLNATKKKLGHGKFGKWCDKHLVATNIMCERTCQRYMKLATENPNVSAFLESGTSIRQSYIAAGILPEPDKDPGANEKNGVSKSCALMSILSSLQKKLRLFAASNEKLKEAERVQLQLVRFELDQFFDQALAVGRGGEEGQES